MKEKIMKIKLNKKITKLQKNMKKQEKQIKILLDKLDQMELKGEEIILNRR